VAVGALVLLLTLLTMAIMDDPTPSQDIRILDWIVGWDLGRVTTLLKIVSTITDKIAGFVYVALAAISLLLTGKAKAEIVFTGVGVTIGAVAVMGDFTLGELLDRSDQWHPRKRFLLLFQVGTSSPPQCFWVHKFLGHLLAFKGKISAANVSRLHCNRTVG